VSISLAPILTFFLNCNYLRTYECFLKIKLFDLTNFEEDGVAEDTEYAQKPKFFFLNIL